MPLDAYLTKGVLDWILGGAAAPTIAGRYIGFATGTPTSVSDSAGPGYRQTVTFASATTGATGTVSNAAGITCTMTAAASVVAWNLYAHTSFANSAGGRLMYGSITRGIKGGSGDYFQLAVGNLRITLT